MKNGLTFWFGVMATPFSFRDDSWTSPQIWNLGVGIVKERLQVSIICCIPNKIIIKQYETFFLLRRN